MRTVFGGILEFRIKEFSGGAKINYFRSRRVRWSIREVQDNVFSFRIIAPKFRYMHQIFGKVLSLNDLLILGGPAGGLAPGKVLRPKDYDFI